MRVVPRSLFGRLVLVLLGGLLGAQLLTGFVQNEDRIRAVYHTSGMQAAQRVATILRLLDRSNAETRRQIVAAVDTPGLRVTLGRPPRLGPDTDDTRTVLFRNVLRRLVGRERPLHVTVFRPEQPPEAGHFAMGWQRMRAMMEGRIPMGSGMMGGGMMGAYLPPQVSFVIHTRLAGGEGVRFEYHPPADDGGASLRLLIVVGVLLLSVVAVSLLAVRWITRPLSALAAAADELGQDIHRPRLSEQGPVEDDGPGISAAERDRVFEPFYRVEGSRSRATGGTGLGLSIARSVAQLHRGSIRLGDSAHGGLAVSIELPRG